MSSSDTRDAQIRWNVALANAAAIPAATNNNAARPRDGRAMSGNLAAGVANGSRRCMHCGHYWRIAACPETGDDHRQG